MQVLNKKIGVAAIFVLIIMASFTVGAYAAGTGLLSGPWGEIEVGVKSNTDELIDGLDDILAVQISEVLNNNVEAEIGRANTLIMSYYNCALQDLEDNPKMKDFKNDLGDMTNVLVADEIVRIDNAIAELLGQ